MSTQTQIVVTEADMRRLESLVDSISSAPRISDLSRIEALEQELGEAQVVPSEAVARNRVTMNSRVRVRDLDRGGEQVYTLVYPAEADSAQGRISVLAPIGTALLGSRSGQIVKFPVPGGLRALKILAVEYQPESAGLVGSDASR